MVVKLRGKTKKERILLARHFGYGVPQLARALASAEQDLALISDRTCSIPVVWTAVRFKAKIRDGACVPSQN